MLINPCEGKDYQRKAYERFDHLRINNSKDARIRREIDLCIFRIGGNKKSLQLFKSAGFMGFDVVLIKYFAF
jgi:hypothetical protein